MLALIAQCGRASPTWQTGRLGVVWEDAGRAATALIAPGNIVAGSFAAGYATGQAADEIAVRYIEPALDWQYNTLRRRVPVAPEARDSTDVAGPPASTATLTLHGVTDAAQAALECNLQAARQLYHRRRLSWEMAAEGLSIARGDVVHITHSLIDGGSAGRLAGGTADRVVLDRAVDPGDMGAAMLFRLPDGTVHQSAVSRPPGVAGESDELVLAEPLPAAPDAHGMSPLDTLWRLYDESAPPARARIVAVEPASDRRVRFSAIDEAAAYHAAATADLTAPFPALSPRAPRVLAVTFAETLVRVGAGYAVEIAAALTVAGDWRGGVVRAAVDDAPARTVARLLGGETEARWLAPPAGTLAVTVTPGTEAVSAGAHFAAEHEIVGFLAPPGPPTNFLIDVLGDGTRRLRWTPPGDVDLAGVAIRYAPEAAGAAPAWDDMTPLHKGHLTASPLETVEPPPGGWVFAARAVDTGGRLSTDDVRIVAALGPQRLGDALLWRCPGALGWPGTIVGAVRSDDGQRRAGGRRPTTPGAISPLGRRLALLGCRQRGRTRPPRSPTPASPSISASSSTFGAALVGRGDGRRDLRGPHGGDGGGACRRRLGGLCAGHHRRGTLVPASLASSPATGARVLLASTICAGRSTRPRPSVSCSTAILRTGRARPPRAASCRWT